MKYPQVLISDCNIKGILIKNDVIIIQFDEYGVFLQDKEGGKYERKKGIQLVLHGCSLENFEVQISHYIKKYSFLYFVNLLKRNIVLQRKYTFSFNESIIEMINNGNCTVSIVDEYYNISGGVWKFYYETKKERGIGTIEMKFEKAIFENF